MIIYPAIDIRKGKCVRLTQGLEKEEKIYFEDPLEVGEMWVKQGGKFLHVVDLDGAFRGASTNKEIIKNLVEKLDIPIQIGGGIRRIDDIEDWLQLGVQRVILGTKALENNFIKKAVKDYGTKIVVALDARDGLVTTEGWAKTSGIGVSEFVKTLEDIGVKTMIYTDISRDGTLIGPNFQGISTVCSSTSMEVIASGGVSSIDDLVKLNDLGVEGVIVGKALYEGRFTLQEVEVALR